MEKNSESATESLKVVARLTNTKGVFDVEKQLQSVTDRVREGGRFEEKLAKIEMSLSWKYLRVPPVPYLPRE